MHIRKYEPKDRENIRYICHQTTNDIEFIKNQELVCLLYADYYCDYESDNVFVLANAKDEAVGYILCAEDYKRYIRLFKKHYMKKVQEISLKQYIIRHLDFISNRKMGKKYPAHMHIDLLPEVQRGGWGTKLVDTLTAHLKQKGVKGLWLGVGADNEKGVNFYKKYGFKLYHEIKHVVLFFVLDLKT